MIRRTHRNNKSSTEPIVEAENPMQMKGVAIVDAIPSPELAIPTLVEEKTK